MVVYIINNLLSQSEWIMTLVRAFTLQALEFNVLVHAQHVLDPRAKEFPKVLTPEVASRAIGLTLALRTRRGYSAVSTEFQENVQP